MLKSKFGLKKKTITITGVIFFKWYKVGAKQDNRYSRGEVARGEICSIIAHGCRGGRQQTVPLSVRVFQEFLKQKK